MTYLCYQVDAFTDRLFGGNPAGVVPLDTWLPDEMMQAIAAENNLAETAFFVPRGGGYHIRWFTPRVEVNLCGHATLAAAHILFRHLNYAGEEISFDSRSGRLAVRREDPFITLDFPADEPRAADVPEELIRSLGRVPRASLTGREDWLLVYSSQREVEALQPDFERMLKGLQDAQQSEGRGVIVTAPGEDVDFVSRFFAPLVGIPEDPVTGSAHTTLTPYWAQRLGKTSFTARQVSRRGGFLKCRLRGERVDISGQAVTYLAGEIRLSS
jgi:PhzF family phenazine biosynthesis protein